MPKILLISLMFFSLSANADGIGQLRAFFDHTTSMRARFHQLVTDSRGQKVQEVSGSMQLQRPGKFRWDYEQPYQQEIVGDGTRVWLFDPDLNQVTVRSMGEAIGASPAALLAGGKAVENNFTLENLKKQGGLEWVQARPKGSDSGFDAVKLGFGANGLEQMELHDSYGNLTTIRFSRLERNPGLDAGAFVFTPPPDADVVGE